MKKAFACLLALALVFALAACGGEAAVEVAGTQIVTTEGNIVETADPIETSIDETSAAETSIAETTSEDAESSSAEVASTQKAGEGPAVPTDTAGIIRYYNEALANTPMQRTSWKRSMTKITGFAKALGLTIMDEPNLEENPDVLPYVHDADNAVRPSDLVTLEPGWVAGASSAVRGGEATLTISLKNHAISANLDPKPGTLGYVGTLDKATVVPLVCEVAMALAAAVISPNALKEVDVTDSSFGLSGGIYAVTVDIATGNITGLTFTATQHVEGNAKCVLNIPLIPASANAFVTLRGDLTAVYAPK